MSPERKHNLIWLPFVVFVRIPILLPFWLLRHVVKFGEWLEPNLPGLRVEPRRPKPRPHPQEEKP